MIIVFHKQGRITGLRGDSQENLDVFKQKNIISSLFDLAQKYPSCILVWCHESLKDHLNIEGVKASFQLKNTMLSYGSSPFFSDKIGYVEDSPFLKVNKSVKYPTWLMSSQVGAIHASQLLKFQNKLKLNDTFDFVLNAIAKQGMPNGLFCYSEPNLLNKGVPIIHSKKASNIQLFKFVKQHYKSVWSSLLLLNIIVNEGKFPIWAFIRNLFIKQQNPELKFDLEPLIENTSTESLTIDVIIPTIGRKKYLHDVLKDLANQSLLPKQVIIVEQNDAENSKTELDFIKNETWPFKIIHKFTYQTGVCNARNLALSKVTADLVYLADDDNRFKSDLLELIDYKMRLFNLETVTMSYLQKNEKETKNQPFQWPTFGAGSSVVSTKYIKSVAFDMSLEFGYGEDVDFGMQLRNLGLDIIYFPNLAIEHLKAPIGGFRKKVEHPWEASPLHPKPSPTIMYNKIKNSTKQQLLGYKTVLFFKYYKVQKIKNPIAYYKLFKKQWAQSLHWAKKLNIKT